MNKFDTIVAGSLDIAHAEAMRRKNTEVHPLHLVWGLLKNPASSLSRSLDKGPQDKKGEFQRGIEEKLKALAQASHAVGIDQLRASRELSECLTKASALAIQEGKEEVGEREIFASLFSFLPPFDFDKEALEKELNERAEDQEVPSFLRDLNKLAQEGKLDPVTGREREIRAVMEILGRRNKNNPVLVGPAGVGKTAIVEGLALAITHGHIPDILQGKTVYALDMGALMAGTKFRGEFEERLQGLIKFLKARAGQSLLFIDEMHQLVGAGKTEGAMDAANLLKPSLARGELHCIGATTQEEYQKYILGDAALDRRFRPVPIEEPSLEDSIEILMGLRDKLEAHHGIKISDEAIYSAVTLSDQYITNKNLPDKAIDLVDEAASALKLSAEAMPNSLAEKETQIRQLKTRAQFEGKNGELEREIGKREEEFLEEKKLWEKEVLNLKRMSELTNQWDRYKFELEQAERKADYEMASRLKYQLIPETKAQLEEVGHDWSLGPFAIAQVINRQTGIPVEKILKDKQDNILELEDHLKGRVFGQEEALHEISETLMTSHAGLKDETKPLGSFLLRGPSGVGKTESAKALAEFLFNSEKNIVRLDMSEFSEKHSVSKLIGAPAGYVGYEEEGVLTKAVRLHPYSVVLFDEIEKAHRDFSDILLQILDDGRLTDNKGRTIDFKNTIILMTTNSRDLEGDFRPELLGRLDGILNFNPLDKKVMKDLVGKELKLLNLRLASKKIHLELDEKAIEVLSERGYGQHYGARPLSSVFNQLVIRPLSRELLQGHLGEGDLKGSWDERRKSFRFS